MTVPDRNRDPVTNCPRTDSRRILSAYRAYTPLFDQVKVYSLATHFRAHIVHRARCTYLRTFARGVLRYVISTTTHRSSIAAQGPQ